MSRTSNPKRDLFDQLAIVARALGSGARLELLDYLAQGERSVEDLARISGLRSCPCRRRPAVEGAPARRYPRRLSLAEPPGISSAGGSSGAPVRRRSASGSTSRLGHRPVLSASA